MNRWRQLIPLIGVLLFFLACSSTPGLIERSRDSVDCGSLIRYVFADVPSGAPIVLNAAIRLGPEPIWGSTTEHDRFGPIVGFLYERDGEREWRLVKFDLREYPTMMIDSVQVTNDREACFVIDTRVNPSVVNEITCTGTTEEKREAMIDALRVDCHELQAS